MEDIKEIWQKRFQKIGTKWYYPQASVLQYLQVVLSVNKALYSLLRQILLQELLSRQTKTLLDIGCGTGRFTKFFSHYRFKCHGIDFLPQHIAKARKTHPSIEFTTMSATALDFKDNSFDVVTSIMALECMKYPEQKMAIAEMKRVSQEYVVMVELDDTAQRTSHIFPRSRSDWISSFAPFELAYDREIRLGHRLFVFKKRQTGA